MVATTLVTACPPSFPPPYTFPRDPALQPLSFVFTFVPENPFACRARPPSSLLPPSLPVLRDFLSQRHRASSSFPPPVRSSNAVAIFGIPYPPSSSSFFSWNKRGTAQSRQKISKSLDKGVLETPLPSPSHPSPPLSCSISPSCKCGASRKRKRRNFGRCFLYLSWCWTYRREGEGGKFSGMKFCSKTARSTGRDLRD